MNYFSDFQILPEYSSEIFWLKYTTFKVNNTIELLGEKQKNNLILAEKKDFRRCNLKENSRWKRNGQEEK